MKNRQIIEGKFKGVAIMMILLLFVLPFSIRVLSWTIVSTTDPSPENIEKGTELIAESAVPWWIGIIEWLASLPGLIAAVLIIVFIIFLKWIGEIRWLK